MAAHFATLRQDLAAAGFKSLPTSIKNMLAGEFAGSALKRTTAHGKRILSPGA
jgi:hypothetical protein